MELLQDFYETTLEALKDAKNDRLWFKTNTKLGKLYYDRGDFNKLAKILKQLHQSCQVFISYKYFICSNWYNFQLKNAVKTQNYTYFQTFNRHLSWNENISQFLTWLIILILCSNLHFMGFNFLNSNFWYTLGEVPWFFWKREIKMILCQKNKSWPFYNDPILYYLSLTLADLWFGEQGKLHLSVNATVRVSLWNTDR